jgi:hypothetical protein
VSATTVKIRPERTVTFHSLAEVGNCWRCTVVAHKDGTFELKYVHPLCAVHERIPRQSEELSGYTGRPEAVGGVPRHRRAA